jgi:hypothetical protein
MCATCLTLLIILDVITLIDLVKRTNYEAPHALCSLLQPPATSSLLGPNNLLSTFFPNIPYLRSSPTEKDPYKTTGKIMVLDTLIFKLLDRIREDKRL